MSAPFQLNHLASSGFSKASEYDTHRPTYPPTAVTKFLTNLNLANETGARIIDLASGTGKFTEILASREEGYEILAVEPHEGMRRELVGKGLRGVRVLEESAGEMAGVEDEWADGVVVAQAFHWFANEESLKEIHRVLRPAGTLGLIWNVEDYNSPKDYPTTTPWEQVLKDILASLEDGQPRYRHLAWNKVFEDQLNTTPLETLVDTFTQNLPRFSLPLGEDRVKWTVWLNDEAVWLRYATLSQIANLGDGEREGVRKRVLEALKGEGTERNGEREVAVHGVTHFVWTSRV